MKKPIICHVGPISIHSHRLMSALSQSGYSIALITDSRGWIAPEFDRSSRVLVLPSLTRTNFPKRFVPNSIRLLRILKGIHPDLVHLHAEHQYGPGIALSGFPFVLNSWGQEVLELPTGNFLGKTLAKTTARKARMVIVDAKILKDVWVSAGVPCQKVRVIPFGVDVGVFNPTVDGLPIRKKLGLGKADAVVISTRPFYSSHYNVDCLIRAIPLVVDKHPDAKFIIKGSGPLEGYLKELTRDLDVSGYVHFAGLVPHDELAEYLRAADIYVSTSFVDSTSVSLLEAMACGLAPVVTDIPGNREWVQDGVNGSLFPPRDHRILADKITQLIENEAQRKHFGELCIQIIGKRAVWKKCVSEIEAVYRELL